MMKNSEKNVLKTKIKKKWEITQKNSKQKEGGKKKKRKQNSRTN